MSEPPRVVRAVDSLAHPTLNLPLAVAAGIAIADAGGTGGRGAFEALVFTLLACTTLLFPSRLSPIAS